MYTLAIVLIFIVCILLTLVVLVQNSKGGGLSSSFSGNNQIMGVRRTTDFLEKATWYLAGALLVLCVFASAAVNRQEVSSDSMISDQIENAIDPSQAIDFPTATQPAAEETDSEEQ